MSWAALTPDWGPGYTLLMFLLANVGQVAQFVVPVALMAWHQPRRDAFRLRCALVLGALLVGMTAVSVVGWSAHLLAPEGSMVPYVVNFCCYALYLAALAGAVLLCFDTGRWNALLYATAGYTVQNLGTGAGELIRIVCEAATGATWDLLASTAVTDVVVALAIWACWRLFMRQVRDAPPLRRDSRGMLGMAGAVIAVVIANDVVIRGLDSIWSARVVPLPFLVTFRVTHLVVCAFVLYAEYEVLFNARLRAEADVGRRMAEERERQWELSRQQVEAVNRRVHDVRHAVVGELARMGEGDRVGADGQVLRDVTRSIGVYDAVVHTGNAALDTVLSTKGLLCQERGIALTCIADGPALAFLPAAETYALFDDLLGEAIACVESLPQGLGRSVSLNVHARGALVSVHVGLPWAEGAGVEVPPLATAREVVRAHGGTLATTVGTASLSVDALLPRPMSGRKDNGRKRSAD